MKFLNLGILAHVDAGKTSLTEQLLYTAGIIDEIGSVDAGNTQTDSLALEQQRGITIKSAVVSFVINNTTVNLIDTPGHSDFIAEVERVLGVLDGVILVISAVEGVQPQTRVLMRILKRLRIPTVIFVNKIDRSGARYESLIHDIKEKLGLSIVAMGLTHDLGSRSAGFTLYEATDTDLKTALADLLSNHNDNLLAEYVDSNYSVSGQKLLSELAAQTKKAQIHPVFFGSAITGAGIDSLFSAITELLPLARSAPEAPVFGVIFKIERGPAGERVAYIRMFAGTIRTRDILELSPGTYGKVTAIQVFANGATSKRSSIVAGEIGKVWGLNEARIGNVIGQPHTTSEKHYFAPPTLETVVVPHRLEDKGALHSALSQLAEQDPLINLRQDDIQNELFVSLYGEVQKEVIQATLASDFNLEVGFKETTTICIEQVVGVGEAVEIKYEKNNQFLATIGLRVEPEELNGGNEFHLANEVLGTMPAAFFKAVEDSVYRTLNQGINGWQVTNCKITMTHAGYAPRQSHAHARFDKSMSSTGADFRGLTPLVLMNALKQAGTKVCEPIHYFRLEIPEVTYGTVLPLLTKLAAIPHTATNNGTSYMLEGDILASHINNLQQQLPALTSGEGLLECIFDRYAPVRGKMPMRSRTDHNPLDRKEYLLNITKRL